MSGKITTDSLIGAWRLQRAIQVFDDGQVLDEFGAHSDGYLCYTPDGTVSAVLGSSDRPPLDAPDPQAATADEYASAAQRFIAYAGRFTIESEDGLVTHHIDVSLFPNWEGQAQPRQLTMEDDRLVIVASERTAADGRPFHVELHWSRPS